MAARHLPYIQVLQSKCLSSLNNRPVLKELSPRIFTITTMATIATYRVPKVENEIMVRQCHLSGIGTNVNNSIGRGLIQRVRPNEKHSRQLFKL